MLLPRIAIESRDTGGWPDWERRVSLTDLRWVLICWSTAVGRRREEEEQRTKNHDGGWMAEGRQIQSEERH